MKIKELNLKSRPRERLISQGPKALSDVEILAILLNNGIKNMSALDLANSLLQKYTLKELIDIEYQQLIKENGIKVAKASKIIAAFELAKRAIALPSSGCNFKMARDIYDFLKIDYCYAKVEKFILLLLDSQLRLIKKEVLREGFAANVELDIKDLVRNLFKYEAYGFIIAHNHPSGNPTPSKSDKYLTNFIYKFCKELNFVFIDHIIWSAKDKYYSFSETGFFNLCDN